MRIFEALGIAKDVHDGRVAEYSIQELRDARNVIYRKGNPDDYVAFNGSLMDAIIEKTSE